jgi:arsenite methyltransferase
MFFDTVLRTQFGRPSGLVGSVFMRPLLNVANKRLMSASIELLDVRPKDVVLDVGFGGGYSLFLLAEKANRGRIAGIDYSPEMVSAAGRGIAQKNLQSRVRVQCGNVMALPFQDVAFDKALTVNSIYYWPDLLKGLREMARVLKRRGQLAVGFRPPITLRPFTLGWKNFHLYEPEEVAERMAQVGMDVVRVERRDQWLPLDGVVMIGQRR